MLAQGISYLIAYSWIRAPEGISGCTKGYELQGMAYVLWHGIFDNTTESSAGTKKMDRPPGIASWIGAPEGIPGSKHGVNVIKAKLMCYNMGNLIPQQRALLAQWICI